MKTAQIKQLLSVLLVTLCLTGLTGLEPVLHNHDLDQDAHEDCFSCGWTQINLNATPSSPEILDVSFSAFIAQFQSQPAPTNPFSAFSSRAPPVLR